MIGIAARLGRSSVLLATAILPLSTYGCAAVHQARTEAPRILFYLHGKVVEEGGPRGVNPRWGAYDYPGIVKAPPPAIGQRGLPSRRANYDR